MKPIICGNGTNLMIFLQIKNEVGGAWQAQSIECITLDLRVVSSSPTLGVELILKKKVKKKYMCLKSCKETQRPFPTTWGYILLWLWPWGVKPRPSPHLVEQQYLWRLSFAWPPSHGEGRVQLKLIFSLAHRSPEGEECHSRCYTWGNIPEKPYPSQGLI